MHLILSNFCLLPVLRRCLRRCAISALVALMVGCLLPQPTIAEETSQLPTVLSNCRALLARLSYLHYTIKATPIREINHPRNQMTWREEGIKCRYDFFGSGQ